MKCFLITVRYGLIGVLFGILVPCFVMGQQVVTGVVKSDKGDFLTGASVQEKGNLKNGVTTDAKGSFRMEIKGGMQKLIISSVGFLTSEVDAKNAGLIVLVTDDKALSDVVVIGYSEVSRRKVSASVSTVRARGIENIPLPTVDMMLQGKAAGVNIQVFSGEPGAKPSFVVRGNTAISRNDEVFNATSDPLIVIDGIPREQNDFARFNTAPGANILAGINPNDIESIDILKDASAAAIYGSRGANGVVLIKTKKGRPGKPRISLNSYAGFTQSPRLPAIYIGAAERRLKINQIYDNGDYWQIKNNPIILTDSLNPAFNNNTDWFGLLYQPGFVMNHDVSVSGGAENANYRLSLGYYDEKGTLVGTGFKRYSLNFNNNLKIGDRLNLSTNIRYNLTVRKPVSEARQRNITGLNPDNFPSSLYYMTETNKNNYLGKYTDSRDENGDDNFTVTALINYRIAESLNFLSNLSVTNSNSRRDVFNASTATVTGIADASSSAFKSNNYLASNYLNYDKKFGSNHQFEATAGTEYNFVKGVGTYLSGDNIASDQIRVVQGASNLVGTSSYNAYSMLSYFSRLSYYYKERYNVSLSWRADASSRFGKDNRWGYFPSASAYWILSDEPFMGGLSNTVNLLKLRASYGVNGRQSGDDYGSYNRYRNVGGFPASYGSTVSYNGTAAIAPNFDNGIAQDKLSWEEARQWNVGMDLELFKGRVSFFTDIYNRENHGIRFDLFLPPTSGYGSYYTNAASVRNAGAEFTVQTRNLALSNPFKWSTTITAAFNKNLVIKLPDNNKSLVGTGQWILEVGKPLYQYYMYQYLGVYKTQEEIPFNPLTGKVLSNLWGNPFKVGDASYMDVDGDFVWNPFALQDRSLVGDPNPKWIGGLTNDLNYGNWGLRIQTSFVAGRDVYNESLGKVLEKINNPFGADEQGMGFSSRYGPGEDWYGPEDFVARRALISNDIHFWNRNSSNNANGLLPSNSFYALQYNFTEFNTMYLENGSYFKINNILLSYSFTQPFIKKLKLERFRIYGVLDNVHVFKDKNSRIPDPENVDPYGYYRGTMYGLTRRVTFGVDLGF